ncbi:NUDIX hydrolase [Bacillus sp. es.036]|uniref:NUDIX hydrolase n=1 Tax=Bacillus sp. es.036 TaxID=1761764 RepID=UPI000BF43A46|nr:NUDIX domain-containing protein [Bacillus sp. es.036]PFG12402.1 NUDIX domain-containing protein [Bacillus sp. es.036]
MTIAYVQWGAQKVKLSWNGKTAPDGIVTSAHGFCFNRNQLLLVNLKQRGWDFPGGHIEAGESPEACLAREAMEEGYVKGVSQFIGSLTVDHSENPNWNEQSAYPKVGYQLFYRMDIREVLPFEAEHESMDRMFVDPYQIGASYKRWNEVYQAILEAALKLEEKK